VSRAPSALGEPPCGTRFVVSLPAELGTLLEEAALDELELQAGSARYSLSLNGIQSARIFDIVPSRV
jgi:hypothetical protein